MRDLQVAIVAAVVAVLLVGVAEIVGRVLP
ncbi:hypothetical protein HNQ70_000311 [Quisquiliibacterium transsilvanicum]|uniref:Uncharacterized protein n=1 Tax=Quisquiliibacterium transsilvanicum TaxID=1549638 RepID=A0A7W8M792_9BURK|nr:hypothetical protein [Quisquiliibacterium transsilvanicum]